MMYSIQRSLTVFPRPDNNIPATRVAPCVFPRRLCAHYSWSSLRAPTGMWFVQLALPQSLPGASLQNASVRSRRVGRRAICSCISFGPPCAHSCPCGGGRRSRRLSWAMLAGLEWRIFPRRTSAWHIGAKDSRWSNHRTGRLSDIGAIRWAACGLTGHVTRPHNGQQFFFFRGGLDDNECRCSPAQVEGLWMEVWQIYRYDDVSHGSACSSDWES